MNELLQIFFYNINMYLNLISNKFFMKNFLVIKMNAKTEFTLIVNQATETVMKNLLIQYFINQNHATSI